MEYEDRYVLWNYMLAEHCLLADSCEGVVLLTVTPRILTISLDEAGGGVWSPREAEADFIATVAAVYRGRVLGSSGKLRALKSTTAGDVPFCIGFLALSVLAAFHMRTDDEYTGRAFYPRLAEMLGCGLTRSHPVGFEGEAFLELWDELGAWLKKNHDRDLAVPDAAGVRKYVAYPFAHVALREVDMERLPQFFDSHGYEPGARAPLDRLTYDLYLASGPWRYFTESGRSALDDRYRRPFVVRQVAQELDRWDGCRTDSSGGRTATIELWMDIRRRRAQLYLLARRPAGFPEFIEDGELVFSSSQDAWYEPVPLSRGDGALLEHGLRAETRHNGARFYLQRKQARVIPLTPSEAYTGFVSDRVLRADTDCAVLCADSMVGDVARHLEVLTGKPVRPRSDDTIPSGWCLFTEVRATNDCAPPPGMENLGLESSLVLIPDGGLRLGRRWQWLESAPARLTVLGAHRGLSATIDSRQIELDESGRMNNDLLHSAGQHVIEIGNRLRQRVSVLKGIASPYCRPWVNASEESCAIPVPSGNWALLGTLPGQLATVSAPAEGALVLCTFSVQWAVRVTGGVGAMALHIHHGTDTTAVEKTRQSLRVLTLKSASWAGIIYQTGVRHPLFRCLNGCSQEQLETAWGLLMEAARHVKRAKRRR